MVSGSSSCAAAAVAHKLGFCDRDIAVVMPGGKIDVAIGADYQVTMIGAVTPICVGEISIESMSL